MEVQSLFTCQLSDSVNLVDFVFQYFDEYGNRDALIDAQTGRKYTFAQIKGLATKFASAITRRGLKKGDIVAIYSPNVPEYAIVFFGTILAGGTVSTCNPLYTVKELAHQLELSDAQHIFTVNVFAEKAKEAAAIRGISNIYVLGSPTDDDITSFQDLLKDDGSALKEITINPTEDVAVLPFSSGTTGLPKGVMLTHYNIISNVSQAAVKPFFAVDEEDVMLALLPWFHIYGMVTILFVGLRFGAKVVSMTRFDPKVFLETIQTHKVTIAPIVPPIAVFLSKHPLVNNFDVSCLRDVVSAAAPLGKDTQNALIARLGVSVRQGYGMTEMSPVVTVSPANKSVVGSVGKLVPHTKAKVVSVETGEAVATGESGELCFKGPQVMKGYLKNKAATDKTIDEDGWLHTGDIGYYDESGNFYVVDRLKELIKYKGFQVPPAELEELLLTHPKVADAAVIGVPDVDAGELPKAFVVRSDSELTEEEIVNFIASEVGPHKKLRGGVQFIETIPKSASGKILRRKLKEQEIERLRQMTQFEC